MNIDQAIKAAQERLHRSIGQRARAEKRAIAERVAAEKRGIQRTPAWDSARYVWWQEVAPIPATAWDRLLSIGAQ